MDLDPELLSTFLAESVEHVDQLEEALGELVSLGDDLLWIET